MVAWTKEGRSSKARVGSMGSTLRRKKQFLPGDWMFANSWWITVIQKFLSRKDSKHTQPSLSKCIELPWTTPFRQYEVAVLAILPVKSYVRKWKVFPDYLRRASLYRLTTAPSQIAGGFKERDSAHMRRCLWRALASSHPQWIFRSWEKRFVQNEHLHCDGHQKLHRTLHRQLMSLGQWCRYCFRFSGICWCGFLFCPAMKNRLRMHNSSIEFGVLYTNLSRVEDKLERLPDREDFPWDEGEAVTCFVAGWFRKGQVEHYVNNESEQQNLDAEQKLAQNDL